MKCKVLPECVCETIRGLNDELVGLVKPVIDDILEEMPENLRKAEEQDRLLAML